MMPPAKTIEEQQQRFDEFRNDYNNVRPHQALDDDTPASRYRPSDRRKPEQIDRPTYPGHFEVRKVDANGSIKLKNQAIFLSNALAGEYIGLEEIDYEIWDVVFYRTSLGRYNEQTKRVT